MKKIKVWLVTFYHEAKGKLTTYVAIATAGLTELVTSWDSAAAILPHWIVANKAHIFSLAALVPIWTRIRRMLREKVAAALPSS